MLAAGDRRCAGLLTVNDIFFFEESGKFEIVAGENGLDNEVGAISFIDAPTSIEWLKGKEIILTTAFLYQEDERALYRFVQALIKQNVSALGIKIERYIKKMPQSIIDLADRNKFPIISMPYEMVWSEVLDRYYKISTLMKGSKLFLDGGMKVMQQQMDLKKGDKTLLRSLFVENITIATAIVDNKYSVYSMNVRGATEQIQMYCTQMAEKAEYNAIGKTKITCQDGCWIGEAHLTSNERLIVASETQLINRYEVEKLCVTYNSLLKRTWLRSNHEALWQYLIEGLVTDSMDAESRNIADHLSLTNNNYFMFFSAIGSEALKACDEMRRLLQTYPAFKKSMIHFMEMEVHGQRKAVGIVSTHSKDSSISLDIEFRRAVGDVELPGHYVFYCGKGTDKFDKLQTSCDQAAKAEHYSKILMSESKNVNYRDFAALDRLIHAGQGCNVIAMLRESFLSFDAVQTLEALLEHKNIRMAANACFIHENTMRYRIRKIKEALGSDLKDPMTCINLLIQIKIWRITQAEPEGGERRQATHSTKK